jgi:hypothetical protein
MRRDWNTVRNRDLEGSERSYQLLQGLAAQCDPETAEMFVHIKSLLDSNGGQFFIAARREKYAKQVVRDEDTGSIIGEVKVKLDDHKVPGVYETDGYYFHFDHIATALREHPREPDTKTPGPPRDEVVLVEGEPEDEDIESESTEELEANLEDARAAGESREPSDEETDEDDPRGDGGAGIYGESEVDPAERVAVKD